MSDENKEKKKKKGQKLDPIADDSHEYDGIKELNNPAPYWIMAVFFVSIGFSMIYYVHNFGYPSNKKDQISRYEASITKFEEKQMLKNARESGTAVEMTQKQIIEAGATLYVEKACAACHGTGGEGNLVGPNLTDDYWLNGCKEEEIFEVISEGRATKGMTPYKTMMTEKQMKYLVSYIKFSLVGSNPANPKAAQGTECK